MVSEIFIDVFLVFTAVIGVVALLFVALWRRKSRIDARNYRALTGDSKVKTVHTVEEYKQLRRKREDATDQ